MDRPTKLAFSKYDFVKVRVYINEKHYYVLSRFLVSRVLTAARVQFAHAIRISLDLKKYLVDQSKLETSQLELEQHLFEIMHDFGYGDIHKNNYRMMSSFHHQRIPIIIFIAGMPCVGKSTLATMLSERLNMPTVLKTDLLCDILRSGFNLLKGSDCGDAPLSLRRFESIVEITDALDNESDLIAKGLHCDFIKCITEGKAMIVEGLHVSMRMISKLKQLVAEHINSGIAEKVIVVPLIITINNARLHRELIEN
ncbi:hypothetical protein MP638_003400, partial [Amoeboaphelidium occidentale]